MKTPTPGLKTLIAAAAGSLLLVACSTAPTAPAGAADVRSKLTRLQSDPQLASRAPVAIEEAQVAVRAAEEPRKDAELARHLVLMADRKVDTAEALAQGRLYEDQRKTLGEQRESARLDSRTREADAARSDAEASRMDSEAARRQTDDLQRQIAELNAKTTERGLVVTLGDMLFDTGRAELRCGAIINLDKLAAFLNEYQDRSVIIEGHTDSVGSEDYNLGLSQRRADSVKTYLVRHNVAFDRITVSGKGEGSPIAGNDSTAGRQQNRRVEDIISNTVSSL
jgi:outer membrane protein OmpA-like peptidoglycan-associated protein